jgi:phosphate transport system substrate-binding protein
VRRADGSGTTFNFTNYLSRVHPEWKAKVGEGAAVNWPVGAGGKGNEGVASFVNRLPNSIGYVEYSYVKQNKMTYTLLRNKHGAFVEPSEEAFKAAAAGADWNTSFYQLITDQPGKGTWPISTATFILMHNVKDKPANATEAFKFFTWAFKNGAKATSDLDYVALPDSVVASIEKAWAKVKDASGQPVALK